MSNRFNWEYDDEDEDNINDRDGDMDNTDLENALKQELIGVQLEQVEILQQDVDEKVMQDAINIASKDWLWYFKSPQTKVKVIKKIYMQLKNIMDM
jgi:hypothetical protein